MRQHQIEYEPEALLAFRVDQNDPSKRYFRVKWRGYRDTTWEPETALYKCYSLVKKACEENGWAATCLAPFAGADLTANDAYNTANWVTLDDIKAKVSQEVNAGAYRSDLDYLYVDASDDFPVISEERSYLVVAIHRSHCFVLLRDISYPRVLIADGQDMCIADKTIVDDFASLLGVQADIVRPLSLAAGRRLAIDHCGTAAVGLALELTRLYKVKEYNGVEIVPPQKIMSRVASSLHSELSVSSQKGLNITSRKKVKCSFCKKYSSWQKKSVCAHERKCRLRVKVE